MLLRMTSKREKPQGGANKKNEKTPRVALSGLRRFFYTRNRRG
jgi:hypothetical protein